MQNNRQFRARRPGAPSARPNQRNRSKRPQNTKKIDPRYFINTRVEPQDEVVYTPTHTFEDFALSPATKQTLAHLGFTSPSPIQDQSIPHALEGRDIIGLANTGTGKTAAFLLPTIQKIMTDRSPVTALVLAPTRELAQQIDEEFKRFAAGQKFYSTLVVGGANIGKQIQQIRRGPHIIIGTPGRIKDLIDRKVLRLSGVTTFILDEADRMCDMGFSRDIRMIASELPQQRQTLCFSATMTPAVKVIVEEFMQDPTTISVIQKQTNQHIEQDVIRVKDKSQKVDILSELLAKDEFEKVIVFGETKFGVQRLADNLTKNGLAAVAIHGNKSQSQRERALRDFKTGKVKTIVATDVAARGLDIPDVTHVINFDPPKVYDDYVHRIGRTGRAGRTGTALTFVSH